MNINHIKKIECLSTGSLNLDNILGIGGLPYGRIIEIFGQESSGKTTLSFSIIKESQKVGDICAYIDVEHCVDINYLENLGINIKKLLIFQPNNGENVFEICFKLINTKLVNVIIIDSIAAIVSQNEINFSDNCIGSHARLISKGLKNLISIIRKNSILFILINQVRTKITNYFSKEISTGGNAIKFYSSIRIELKRIGFLKNGNNIIGQEIKIIILKNKLSKPYRETKIQIIFGYGIYKINEIFNFSIKFKIFKKEKNKYLFNNIYFEKKEIIKKLLLEKEFYKKIENLIKQCLTF
ncbi:DNA recombination/repair protein RecA [Candidatus Carsonella ruddii]|uniref:Protein RecA n=2 Tax=cellular organisms TaxID=131567 RepID=A0AAJ6FDM1_CARRU|nr:ATPase domain-containing protein [Candidatus Carsonella ruddii]WGS66601.1 DNA recombination/repair protein RecA [Candidatus Carsonella ruddii]WGS66799.1 DNA recombination/repair protein RecA [Candidatus Carsonella ruddii]WGS66990.1 DNA recombination/repair protein RecA [Candidatus Carsonella ruddii]WGS67182.1 DNA recombination/repair protein RecA [Candidatus Carsonella ruddii]WMC18198.1 MAG: DNA recombination/repair protein RecA [Candidatus Carsonella ruddii]